jgi:hypothetical protein
MCRLEYLSIQFGTFCCGEKGGIYAKNVDGAAKKNDRP